MADFDRPLAPRGQRDAVKMSRWLAEQPFAPSEIKSSTARRAAETATTMAAGLGGVPVIWDEELYLADLDVLLAAVSAPPSASWLLVGHNPGLETLVEFLCPDIAKHSKFAKLMPTASIYALRIEHSPNPLKRGCAVLLAHQRPKAL